MWSCAEDTDRLILDRSFSILLVGLRPSVRVLLQLSPLGLSLHISPGTSWSSSLSSVGTRDHFKAASQRVADPSTVLLSLLVPVSFVVPDGVGPSGILICLWYIQDGGPPSAPYSRSGFSLVFKIQIFC